jgi:hypothetical protein
LYLASGSPSAAAAIKTLTATLPEFDFAFASVRVVDVLRQPGEALSAGLSCTPTLIVRAGGKAEWFAGDFAQAERVRRWLQGALGDAPAGWESRFSEPIDGAS